MQTDSDFSRRLTERMGAIGLNQTALAGLLHVGQSTVNRWLNGTKPQPRAAIQLAAALSVRMKWLLSGEEPMQPDENEFALRESRLKPIRALSDPVIRGDVAPYITKALDDAALSEDDLDASRELQHLQREIVSRLIAVVKVEGDLSEARDRLIRRIEEYFQTVAKLPRAAKTVLHELMTRTPK